MPGFGGAGLAGLSGVYGGMIGAEGDEATARTKKYAIDMQQAGDIAFGRTLQSLGGGQQQQMPGMQPQGQMPPQMPSQAPPPQGGPGMAGPPPPPQGAPPMPPQGPATFNQRFGAMNQPPMPQGAPPMGGGGMPPQMPPQQQQPMGGQMQPPGGGMGMSGQPALDWRSVLQKVQQANPGAPPQVIAAAVDKFMPLMNQQAQQQWKEIGMQMKGLQIENQMLRGQQNFQVQNDRLNLQRQMYGLPPLSGGQGQQGEAGPGGGRGTQGAGEPQGTAAQIGEAVIRGDQPPDLKGLYRQGPGVKAYLAERRFDQSKAITEWNRAQKEVQALNGPQQVRFRQLMNSLPPALDRIKKLSEQMNQSGIGALNAAELRAKIRVWGNSPQGQLATQYLTLIKGIKGEMAQAENGGYAPTESAWKTVFDQIDETYGAKQMGTAVDELQRILKYREHGMNSVGGGMLSPNAPNRYLKQQPGISDTGEATDKSGWSQDSGAAAGGLPKGWSVEEH